MSLGKDRSCQKNLLSKEELALSAFADGQASWWQKIFAKKILGRSFEARQYVDKLERASEQFKQQYLEDQTEDCKSLAISHKIMQRIEQEERLSLLRSLPTEYSTRSTSISDFFNFDKLAWSSFGAVCASLFFLFLLPVLTDSSLNSNQHKVALNNVAAEPIAKIASANIDGIVVDGQLVAFGSPVVSQDSRFFQNNREVRQNQDSLLNYRDDYNSFGREAAYTRNIKAPVENSLYLKRKNLAPQVAEIDWVRSVGRVKVLRNPNGKASILWVQKKQPTVYNSLDTANQLQIVNKRASPAVEFVVNK